MIPLYSRVVLITDAYEAEGARRGMVGYVIEQYPDERFEVEFSDSMTGVTVAQVVVGELDIELRPESAP